MARYFLEVIYDGNQFHGSQIQGDTPTVQLEINKTLSMLLRQPVVSFGASRTDEGVHALCNFYHFDTGETLHPDFIYKMNSILPHSLAVIKVYTSTDLNANARFNAVARRYRYRIYFKKNPFLYNKAYYYPYKIDKKILEKTAEMIKEHTHFESFSKRNTQSKTFTCNIYQSFWEEHEKEMHYIVEANRFLRGMVRGLVGTQLQAARGKIDLNEFRKIIEEGENQNADFSVPGNGLYLEEIKYPDGLLKPMY